MTELTVPRASVILALTAALFAFAAGVCRSGERDGDTAALAVINKQAWRIDPTQGAPAPGMEEAFEKLRGGVPFIEVFWVASPEEVVVFLFDEGGFKLTNFSAKLAWKNDDTFTLTFPSLKPGVNNVWEYRIVDADSFIYRREEGSFVYRRVPDFNPPPDPFTDLNPLPWK